MDTKETPKVFANRMIQLIIDHSFGEDAVVEPNDYLVIRTAFRNLGGTWEQIMLGNDQTINALKQVVQAWGNSPDRQKKQSVLV